MQIRFTTVLTLAFSIVFIGDGFPLSYAQGIRSRTNCSLYPNARKVELLKISEDLAKRVKSVEMSTGGYRKVDASVALVLKPDGTISKLCIVKSSGVDSTDDDVLRLVKQASPITPYSKNLGDLAYLLTFLPYEKTGGMNFHCDFSLQHLQAQDVLWKKELPKSSSAQMDAFSSNSNHAK